ncbi:adenylate/guanylate cyclase domain-containing protein [Mangrovimicrobium sediminis]|nr:adenylate/guanylate cyclase domain-containing protein [Haliea sp. SAOS-164]
MTSSLSQSATPWSDLLLRSMAELREVYQRHEGELEAMATEDFAQLFASSQRLDALLLAEPLDRHELRNVLSAVRGYGEMLREDLAAQQPELDAALARLLKAADAANDEDGETSGGFQRVIASEPGFILAVDDLKENRELVARYLSRSGHMVVTASSGAEALHTLEQADVDVVLLDLMMPEMDGHEVLRRIKEHPEWRATPVIVISGRQDMDGIIECIEAGADDYLFKPFNPVLLQARIKAGIERKRWHDREELYRQQLERNEKFIRATFGRYLSDEIVTDILERPEGLELGGDLRRVTIMMADIRGFTTISENLAPAQVVTMINRYLGAMTDIIMAQQGTIDEFIGDAILAVFGAPQRREDDADRAARCALQMQAAMDEVNRLNQADGLPEIKTGIALNTGDVIAGNIGSERRSKYGFVGHPMNVTSRIEDATAGGDILIADSTLQALRGNYQTEAGEPLKVKGIHELLRVHRLLGETT